jgi:hypothetical protein
VRKQDVKNDYALVAEIFDNVKEEANAVEGYQRFLAEYTEMLTPGDKKQIMEIISDELNHSEILHAMARRISGIKPATD